MNIVFCRAANSSDWGGFAKSRGALTNNDMRAGEGKVVIELQVIDKLSEGFHTGHNAVVTASINPFL